VLWICHRGQRSIEAQKRLSGLFSKCKIGILGKGIEKIIKKIIAI
jgi:hypothetical protein